MMVINLALRFWTTKLAKFVKGPEVNIFVKEFFSRDVAVVGAVTAAGGEMFSSSATLQRGLVGRYENRNPFGPRMQYQRAGGPLSAGHFANYM